MIFTTLAASDIEKGGMNMEQVYFGKRIASLRKERGMTQEALAQRLGVTNQAVSKWESDQCCPDIMQLPVLADIFEISMDALFGRSAPESAPAPVQEQLVGDLPWPDDGELHAVCYVGHLLVNYKDIPAAGSSRGRFQFNFSCMGFDKWMPRDGAPVVLEYNGSVSSIHSDFSVICQNADIQGSIQAGGSVTCGSVGGNVFAGGDIACTGIIGTDAKAGGDIRCDGMIGASASAGGDLECGGDIGGRVQCSGDLDCRGSIGGDVRADGDVQCSGNISGNVDAGGDIDCAGSIGGNVKADGDVECTVIYGSASAEGDITCEEWHGNR